MDQSIVSRAALARMRTAQKGLSTSVGRTRSCALATALASCADEPCGKLSLNEMMMVVMHRVTPDSIATVDSHTLFTLMLQIEDELQRRADATIPEHVQIVEDQPAKTPFASAVGDDDPDWSELEAMAVRNIHAEVFEDIEF